MSEQLYRVMSDDVKQLYCIESVDGEMFSMQEIVDLLNGQQTTISALKEENEQLRQFINKGRRLSVKELMDNANENELLKKENEQLRKEIEDLRIKLANGDNLRCDGV